MFLIQVSYKKPLPEVDRFLAEHRQFLDDYYRKGILIVSGTRKPRSGGVIFGKFENREAAEKFVQLDPFFREEIANYEIVEFAATRCAKQFTSFLTAEDQSTVTVI
jgi:uncharacterized protein YciI